MRKARENRTPVEKVAILQRHLIDRVPVSDLYDEYRPSSRRRYGSTCWTPAVLRLDP